LVKPQVRSGAASSEFDHATPADRRLSATCPQVVCANGVETLGQVVKVMIVQVP